jgi:hypothetical protein
VPCQRSLFWLSLGLGGGAEIWGRVTERFVSLTLMRRARGETGLSYAGGDVPVTESTAFPRVVCEVFCVGMLAEHSSGN